MKTSLQKRNTGAVISLCVRRAILVAALCLAGTARAGIGIEKAQRELQGRFYSVSGGQYLTWPPCPCGKPAPHFPPDNFYGDLENNRPYAAMLVSNLAVNFYGPGWLTFFAKTSDGIENVENCSNAPPSYTANDFPGEVLPGVDLEHSTGITTSNYPACFTNLQNYILRCRYINVGGGILDPPGQDFLASQSDWLTNGCDAAKAQAIDRWTNEWRYSGELYSLEGAAIERQLTWVDDDWIVAGKATMSRKRFRVGYLQVPYNVRYATAAAKLYLKLIPEEYGASGYAPPVPVDSTFHVLYTNQVTWNVDYISPFINDSTNPPPFGQDPLPPLSGQYDVFSYGWHCEGLVVLLAPNFRTDADQVQCSGCGGGGCTGCTALNSPGKVCVKTGSAHVEVSLGPGLFGDSAGYFYTRLDQPTTNCPEVNVALSAEASSNRLYSGVLKVETSNAFAWFSTNGNGFSMIFSNKTGQGFGSVTMSQSATQVVVLQTSWLTTNSTTTNIFNYYTNSGQWDLVQGGDVLTETRIPVWDNNQSNRTDTIIVKNGNGVVATQSTNYYRLFPWGQTLVQQTVGTGSAARTTTWTYYEPSEGTNYGQLKLLTEPSGRWEHYDYDGAGRLTNKVAQFGNNPPPGAVGYVESSNRVSQTSYDDANGTVTTVEKLLGQEIGRTYEIHTLNLAAGIERVQSILCTVTNAGIGHAQNLTNTVWRTADASMTGKAGDMLFELRQDGTVSSYTTVTNSNNRTNIVCTGAPNNSWQTILTSWSNWASVTDGTTNVSVSGKWGEPILEQTWEIRPGVNPVLTQQRTYAYTSGDLLHRPDSVTYLDGTSESFSYDCCGPSTTTDRDGVSTGYLLDNAHRQVGTMRLGITTMNYIDAAGNITNTTRAANNDNISLHQATYDNAGNLTSETNGLGGPTVYYREINGSGETVLTTIFPDTGTSYTTYYQDGTVKSISGTAVAPRFYTYGADGNGAWTKEFKGTDDSATEWTQTYTDMAGRAYKTVYAPGTATAVSYYNTRGQLTNQVDPDLVSTVYVYNAKGEQTHTILSTNASSNIDWFGDRITFTTNGVDTSTGNRFTRTYVWRGSENTSNLVAETQSTADGLSSWSIAYSGNVALPNRTTTVFVGLVGGVPTRYVTNTAPDASRSISIYQNGRLVSTELIDGGNSRISLTTFTYDPHGRQSTARDDRTGTVTTSYYNNADLVSNTVVAAPGLTLQATTNYFDGVGRVWKTTLPDNTSVTNSFNAMGLVITNSGSRTYPVGYSYDPQGRLKTMTTWTNFAGYGGPATTTNNYDVNRGWLTDKTYADGKGTTYTYKPSGRLQTRSWARGTNTTYAYNNAGDLSTVTYSDGSPGVTQTYDRRGRVKSIDYAGVTTSRVLDDAGNLISESYSGGLLNGLSVTNGYDQYLRRTNCVVLNGSSVLSSNVYGFDSASRLQTAGDGVNSATYSYLANSPLIYQITFKSNSVTRMTTTRQYDNLNRLTSIWSLPTAGSQIGFTYGYNNANQRTSMVKSSDSYDSTWSYGYDPLGQVVGGTNRWGDGTFVAGQQYAYAFDDIGNRRWAKSGGDSAGQGLRTSYYTANNLNQYTGRTVPGAIDVVGLALATNAVTVNGATAERYGQYYRKEISTNNISAAAWLGVTNTASGESTVSGGVFIAPTNEVYVCDYDGNLTTDGHWNYTWDPENRMLAMTNNAASIPQSAQLALRFAYDSQGRRTAKIVCTNSGSAYVPQSTNLFVYDGWNLVAELNPALTPIRTYVWGLDLSGSQQGAGGVGGLVAVNYLQTNSCFAAFDGNGNVAALIAATNGGIVAQFEFGPFGELIRATGPLAKANPFRFSTKYQDDETDLLYYGYRYYTASTGRWLTRDPVGERGGLGLTAFARNSPVNAIDGLGLALFTEDSIRKGHISYSCNCGWIDWDHLEHLSKDLVKSTIIPSVQRYEKSYASKDGGFTMSVRTRWFNYDLNIQLTYASGIMGPNRAATILSILNTFGEAFETAQSASAVFMSGFSVEDLPSNYMGGLLAIEESYPGDGVSMGELKKQCQVLDTPWSLIVYARNFRSYEGAGAINRSYMPKLAVTGLSNSAGTCDPCVGASKKIPDFFSKYDLDAASSNYTVSRTD